MSENTTMLRRAAGVAAIAVLALPGAAFADKDSDSDKGHKKPKLSHCEKKALKGKIDHKHCPPAPVTPVTPQPEIVTVTVPGGPLVVNNIGVSGSGPAAGQINGVPNAAAGAAAGAPTNTAVTAQSAASKAALPCTSVRRFRLHLGAGIRSARVTLNGRRVRVVRHRRTSSFATIDLRRLAKGTYTVRTAVVKRNGKLVTGTRRYRTCA